MFSPDNVNTDQPNHDENNNDHLHIIFCLKSVILGTGAIIKQKNHRAAVVFRGL